ncbi:cobalt-precorrin-6A reductase [Thalassospira sp.]|uniref:cobalt-precorrin-6A reductase n=1 Tax=Thalassospira sp. TaxID=1912094 RepID=UPI0027335949|nr:cobalt-precorrin-6A reductase [Thalassospira sp.]MDP2700428.1 cobalt-precorrin-6A reductase [Thalassospira sp.]
MSDSTPFRRNHPTRPLHVLIFGGTRDANTIARRLREEFGQNIRLQLSLSERDRAPRLPKGVPVRIGPFDGPEDIIALIGADRIDLVIDATDSFATKISQCVAQACQAALTPCIQFRRPAWRPGPDDNWTSVYSMEEAAKALRHRGSRALVAVGRQELDRFGDLPDIWLLVRTVEAPKHTFDIARGDWLFVRGPFSVEGEIELLERHGIDIIVCKNNGGTANQGKLVAARRLKIPVIMVERPAMQPVDQAQDIGQVVEKIRVSMA